MKRKFIFVFIVSLICFSLDSCVMVLRDYSQAGEYPPVKGFQRTVPLESGGRVSVKNLYGDVEIVGWDRDEVDVYAEKKLPPFREERIRIFSFNTLKPQIEVKKLENFVQIRAEIQEINQKQVPVNQYIQVPRPIYLKDIFCKKGNIFISDLYGRISVEVEKGDIHLENCSGSLSASLNEGVFEASLYDLREGDEIQVINQQGDITLALQPQVGARITVKAPKGSIDSEFEQIGEKEKEIQVQIGNGGAQIQLSALGGDIHIRKIKKSNHNKRSEEKWKKIKRY